uniref:Uncharacterized protein n=1 Tax=Leclercia adecarboxylata TaxID=83655 RepID=A0A5B8KQC0_9ENTR|nr:Hypothetical protein [Leclercia adecarboxylata]
MNSIQNEQKVLFVKNLQIFFAGKHASNSQQEARRAILRYA